MQPGKFIISSLLLLIIVSSFQCEKDIENAPLPNNRFYWTHEGVSYSADISGAYEQSVALAPYYIVAIMGTNINTNFTRKVGFSLSSFNTGNYTITPGGQNRLSYIGDGGFNYDGINGTLTITANSNNLLSGNFSVTLAGPAGNSNITGNFSNIPVQP